MTCSEVEVLMVQAVQDELPPSESARLKQHLSGCPHCREAFGELRKVWEMLDSWKAPEPPAGISESFSARLEQSLAQAGGKVPLLQKLERPHVRSSLLRQLSSLAGLAVAAALVAGVFYVFNFNPVAPVEGPSGRAIITVVTPVPDTAGTTLAADARSRALPEPSLAETRRSTGTVALNRVNPLGVFVDHVPSTQLPQGQVQFAIHNFSTNVPEMNTKYYNTVSTLYEDPF